MTLRDKLEEDIRQSMRERNQPRLDALRFLKSAVQAAEKEGGQTLDDARMVDVVSKQVSDRRESIRMFQQGNRVDLASKETAEFRGVAGVPSAPAWPRGTGRVSQDPDFRSGRDLDKGQGEAHGAFDAPSKGKGRRPPKSTNWLRGSWSPWVPRVSASRSPVARTCPLGSSPTEDHICASP